MALIALCKDGSIKGGGNWYCCLPCLGTAFDRIQLPSTQGG